MSTTVTDPVLHLAAPPELNATNAAAFRDHARSLIRDSHTRLDVDLAKTSFVDSSGLGALIALHKQLARQGGSVRISNPRKPVMQILELTRMHRLFEIVHSKA